MICCPNAVVDGWEREILQAFPSSEIAKKTWHPEWKHPSETTPRYLVLNYEQFQQPNSEKELVAFLIGTSSTSSSSTRSTTRSSATRATR